MVAAGSPFQLGINTLAFVATNTTGGPTGLQVVSISGNVSGCNADNQCSDHAVLQHAVGDLRPEGGQRRRRFPTLAGHTPPLTGTCTAAVGTAVCTAAVCDTADNECGLANGDGPCTAGERRDGVSVRRVQRRGHLRAGGRLQRRRRLHRRRLVRRVDARLRPPSSQRLADPVGPDAQRSDAERHLHGERREARVRERRLRYGGQPVRPR